MAENEWKPEKLMDKIVQNLPTPNSGSKIKYDTEVKGFGIRVTAAEAKAFILNYRHAGRERRMTLGQYPAWTLVRARERAKVLKRQIDNGIDPLAEKEERRSAPTVADLCAHFQEKHLPTLRPKTSKEYNAIIRTYILPELKHRKVKDVEKSDIDALHARITKAGAPYRANRTLAVLSKMFSIAMTLKYSGQLWRTEADGNPAKGVKKNWEAERVRELSTAEIEALSKALAEHHDRQAAAIITLLLLTGSRRNEVQGMRWRYFDKTEGTWAGVDLEAGSWLKAASTTKQKRWHQIPLSAPALVLLRELRSQAEKDAVFVFPSSSAAGHRQEIKSNWAQICRAAGIAHLRIHDLRHGFASLLINSGKPIELVKALLGHQQIKMTLRYAHMNQDPQREAAEHVGAIIAGNGK